jgi:hypothetical protein
MSQIERRKDARVALEDQPKGRLTLRVEDRDFPVTQAQNVSNFGLNVVVREAIPVKTPVTVEYMDEGLRLDVYGIVVWSAPGSSVEDNPDGFILGIELFSPTMLTAFLGVR